MILFFFLLWIILNGRVTVELLIFGIVIAAAVFLFARAAFGYSLKTEGMLFRNLPWIVLFVLDLLLEIIRASLAVMSVILNPSRKPDPVLVEFDSDLPTGFQRVLLANSITLTPGTYTVELTDNHYKVHCLIPQMAEGIDESSFVRILRRMSFPASVGNHTAKGSTCEKGGRS